MKSEQIKEITERATEQLTAALNAGHSEAQRPATGVTRVREWRSGVRAEALEINRMDGTQES